MEIAHSQDIAGIDAVAARELGLSLYTLMMRSGAAIADLVRERFAPSASVLILCGPGNNGGDGYAAATLLLSAYDVTVCDVLGKGQHSAEGLACRKAYEAGGGRIIDADAACALMMKVDCLIDAIFGVGQHAGLSEPLLRLSRQMAVSWAWKIAVDIPLGVDADTGRVLPGACRADQTLALSYYKPGLLSYPGRAFIGELRLASLGIDRAAVRRFIRFSDRYMDRDFVLDRLPERASDSHKGTFGRALLLTGSSDLRGAAFLSLEAALRGGAGYVTYLGTPSLVDALLARFPEAIYETRPELSALTPAELAGIARRSDASQATLIGCGGGDPVSLIPLVTALLSDGASPLVIDADAINALAKMPDRGVSLLKAAVRPVILTPHPLEFSRLCGIGVDEVQSDRLSLARSYAKDLGVILVLKGAATVVTDGERLFINSTGSSALAKAGSGDVLAGLLTSLAATGIPPLDAAALAVYFHGLAGDRLAATLSHFGVTPSDLPVAIAEEMAKAEAERDCRKT